jgi:catechol 2,3-dioxygenase-like lactoylglutathione lyase family enzyme
VGDRAGVGREPPRFVAVRPSRETVGGSVMANSLEGLGAITLVVEDIAAARAFYEEVFAQPLAFSDNVSAAFRFGDLIVNLLEEPAVASMIEPVPVAPRHAGVRAQLSIFVDDVDAVCAELESKGVPLLNGPIDRPWGMRTAIFSDPGGHVWEVAQEIGGAEE